tara:strand:+ start:725 stop:1789 length:1065 start_codon:yes stop_codon:yes gene_type:complete
MDYIIPYLHEHRQSGWAGKAKIFISNEKVYSALIANQLISEACRQNDVSIFRVFGWFSVVGYSHLCYSICRFKSISFEMTLNGNGVQLLVKLLSLLIPIKTFNHPQACNIDVGIEAEKHYADDNIDETMLVPSALGRQFYERSGYTDIIVTGISKAYDSWLQFVNQNSSRVLEQLPKRYLLLLTRNIHNNGTPTKYMDRVRYIKMVKTSVDFYREVFKVNEVVIKIHPKEVKSEVEELLRLTGCAANFFISEENTSSLSINADCVVGIFTSAIFDSGLMGIPSVDYYEESPVFKQEYPNGRNNKILGFDCADSSKELSQFFSNVKSGAYRKPEILEIVAREEKKLVFLRPERSE